MLGSLPALERIAQQLRERDVCRSFRSIAQAAKVNKRSSYIAFMATLGLTSLGACNAPIDLKSIAALSTVATEAQMVSDEMADALYQDCLAAREYGGEMTRLGATQAFKGASLSSIPLVGVVPPPPGSPADRMSDARGHAAGSPATAGMPSPNDSSCENDLATSQRWNAFNDGIFDYVQGLSAVAGVSIAPSQDVFKSAAEGLLKIGAVQKDTVADAAGKFVADIGDAVLAHQKDQDLRDLIERSKQGGVFAKAVASAKTADFAYYGAIVDDKSIVDEYFASLINAQIAELRRLASLDGDIAAGSGDIKEPDLSSVRKAMLTRRCGTSCGRHVELAARLFDLRERIARERARWSAIDKSMLVDLDRAQPFYSTMTALERANDALISSRHTGLRGYADALGPYLPDLASDVSSLVKAVALTPSSTQNAELENR